MTDCGCAVPIRAPLQQKDHSYPSTCKVMVQITLLVQLCTLVDRFKKCKYFIQKLHLHNKYK
uniref:Uncharacterized protein n=1 Tax=Anguilla anguilla TaxID=7936 RepID=A0A0E9R308_ANGAN